MSSDYSQFEARKKSHITHALDAQSQACNEHAWDAIQLIHEALPELDFADVSLASTRFGKPVSHPFMVSSMTAGHGNALAINLTLMQACAEMHWAMGVGSQRRELTDEKARQEWQVLRRECQGVTLYGNLGIAQLISSPIDAVLRLTEALEASAFIIHLNGLQECMQPEGTPQFKGGLDAIERLVRASDIPIIIKETGCGFSKATLKRLESTGVAAVDVSGLGGTHWGRIEGMRAEQNSIHANAAETFRNWGISTPESVSNACALNPKFEIWGSGGVRSGLDAAKLIALGATTIGFAKPMLEAALQSTTCLIELMKTTMYELQVALFCTGSTSCAELKEKVRW